MMYSYLFEKVSIKIVSKYFISIGWYSTSSTIDAVQQIKDGSKQNKSTNQLTL